MAAPNCLLNAPTVVSVDGVDLHLYGMVVNEIAAPVPQGRSSVVEIFGRSGDFDFTKNYTARTLQISGSIQADSNATLRSYCDSLKSFFRLRESLEGFKVIFQNQSDRFWLCKYQGDFNITPSGSWLLTSQASYSLVLKCINPYSEAVTETKITDTLTINDYFEITYGGNVPAPIKINAVAPMKENILEAVAGACSEDETLWTYSNGTGSKDTRGGYYFYGSNGVKLTPSSAADAYMEIDITSRISTSKYYVASIYTVGTSDNKLQIIQNGAGGNIETTILTDEYRMWVKLSPAILAGATSIKFRVLKTAINQLVPLTVDGCSVQEITASQFADSDFYPFPYLSDPTGDDCVVTKNPKFFLQAKNHFISGYGDDITGVDRRTPGSMSVVSDPLVPDRKCFGIVGAAAAYFLSPNFYIKSGRLAADIHGCKTKARFYLISYEYYCPYIKSGKQVEGKVWTRTEMGSYYGSTGFTQTAPMSTWTKVYSFIEASPGIDAMQFWIVPEADTITYLKNFMVYDMGLGLYNDGGVYKYGWGGAVVPAQAFEKYAAKTIEWTGSLDLGDQLLIDNDLFIAQLFDISVPSIANTIDKITGERLLLEPGTNFLKLQDYRLADSTREKDSAGALDVVISYRERYL